jgi:hypothetical protein
MSLIGNLEDLSLPDILQIVSLSKKSGILMLEREGQQGKILIRQGRVIQTVSPRPGTTLGELLVGRGLVRPDDLRKALEIQRSGGNCEILGAILVQLGLIDEATLEKVVQEQIEDAIAFFLSWREGTFCFELADIKGRGEFSVDPQAFILERGIDTQWLVMEGTRLVDERTRERGAAPQGGGSSGPAPAGIPREAAPAASSSAHPGPSRPADFSAVPEPPAASPGPAGVPAGSPVRSDRERMLEALAATHAALTREEHAAAAAGLTPAEASLLRDMLGELRRPGAANEIGLLILRFAAELLNRAVLFVIKGGTATGLGGFGVEAAGGADRRGIRGIAIPLDEPSLLEEAVRRRTAVQGTLVECAGNRALLDQLGGTAPVDAVALPLISGGQVRVVLYGDNLPEMRPVAGTRVLGHFLAQAGLTLEKALLEKKLLEGG